MSTLSSISSPISSYHLSLVKPLKSRHPTSLNILGSALKLSFSIASLPCHDVSLLSSIKRDRRNLVAHDGAQPTAHDGAQPTAPSSSPPPLPVSVSLLFSWKQWTVTILLSILLPFFNIKWSPFMKIKNEVDNVVETVEMGAETVEKVAEEVDKVAEEVAEKLPDGGKLEKAVHLMENAAEKTAQAAHLIDAAIDKVQEIEKETESPGGHAFDGVNKLDQVKQHIIKDKPLSS